MFELGCSKANGKRLFSWFLGFLKYLVSLRRIRVVAGIIVPALLEFVPPQLEQVVQHIEFVAHNQVVKVFKTESRELSSGDVRTWDGETAICRLVYPGPAHRPKSFFLTPFNWSPNDLSHRFDLGIVFVST